ncbi:hypothetical protein [Paenarthrobacter aromaticivorans]|uniref:hypothetical protein n=1 Tax=Paenarthrobacter aromaticivorans TaxID=2849150 RepID=UPI003A7F9471
MAQFIERMPQSRTHRRSSAASPSKTAVACELGHPREALHRAKRPIVPAVEILTSDAVLMRDDDEDGVLLGRWYLRGASREALSEAVGQDWETCASGSSVAG